MKDYQKFKYIPESVFQYFTAESKQLMHEHIGAFLRKYPKANEKKF